MISRIWWSAVVAVWLSGSAHAGFIEICKEASPAASLSGLFGFTITGQPGTFLAPVGACTPALQLPNGPAFITEIPKAGSAILGVSTFPTTRLDSFDPITGTARVQIVAGDISTQTLLTFTNTPASAAVPEPGTWGMVGLALGGWALYRRRALPGQL